jgi:tetratricopeptide (TPR) repeat protein
MIKYPTEELKLLIVELSKTEDKGQVLDDKLFLAGKNAFQKMVENNFAASAEVYETAAKKYQQFCYLWSRAGIYRILAKDSDSALVDYSNALQCEPEAKKLHALFADLVKEKDCNLAIQHYSRSLDIDGDSISAFDALSQCYAKLGNKALADEYYKKYKALYFKKGGNPVNFFFAQPLRQI